MASSLKLSVRECLPRDAHQALLVGRAWVPSTDGPSVIGVRADDAVDLTRSYPTVSQLLNSAKSADLRAAIQRSPVLCRLEEIVANSVEGHRDASRPWLLAPSDLPAGPASSPTPAASPPARAL